MNFVGIISKITDESISSLFSRYVYVRQFVRNYEKRVPWEGFSEHHYHYPGTPFGVFLSDLKKKSKTN